LGGEPVLIQKKGKKARKQGREVGKGPNRRGGGGWETPEKREFSQPRGGKKPGGGSINAKSGKSFAE